MVWIVTFTNYRDDYKQRYDSGIYRDKPKLFKTEDETNNYVISTVREKLEEIFETSVEKFQDTHDDYIGDRRLKKYFEFYEWNRRPNTWPSIRPNLPFSQIYELYELFAKGEFVDYLFDWDITQIEL